MPMVASLIYLALVIFALVDLIISDESQVRYLPKVTWVFLIIFLPLIGSLIWIAVGKERVARSAAPSLGDPSRHEDLGFSSGRLGQSSTEAELAALDREIAFHERQEHLKRLEAQVEAKRRGNPA